MARGAPDYSNARSYETLHRLDDLAEVPPRFGEVASIDRGGHVVFSEDFRHGVGTVELASAGLGETIVASPDYSRFGGFTAKMSRVDNASSYVNANLFGLIIETGKIGAEIQFCASGSTPKIELYLTRYTGTQRLLWGLKWDDSSNKVYIGGDTVGWTEISDDFGIFQTPPHFHNMKLVVDVDNRDYERVLIDGKPVAVVAVDALEEDNTNSPHIVVTISSASGQALLSTLYIDYVIATRAEP